MQCWEARVKNNPGETVVLQGITPTPEEIGKIVDDLTKWFVADVVHNLPEDLIRFYTIAFRGGHNLHEVTLCLLTAMVDPKALGKITRIRTSLT